MGEARTTVDGCCLEVRRRGVACARVDLLDAETIVNGVRNGVGRNENHGYFLDFAPLGAGNRLRTVTSDRTRTIIRSLSLSLSLSFLETRRTLL